MVKQPNIPPSAQNVGPEGETREDSGDRDALGEKLESVVAELADPMAWNWMQGIPNRRFAADDVLHLFAQKGLIKQFNHQWGGLVWEINGRQYGRTDPPLQSSGDSQPLVGGTK